MLSRLACSKIPMNGIALASIRQIATTSLRPARGVGMSNRFGQQFGSAFRTGTKAGPTLRERLLGPTTGKRVF